MRNLRYILRLSIAFLSRFKALIAIGIGIGVVIFLILSLLSPIFFGWNIVRIGISGRYNLNSLPNDILYLVGDGLTELDSTGDVKPNLAESWETPDKGKTWIFKIKKGINWHDGKSVTSKSIVYQFSDATVSYPDDSTITFTLQSPYSAFPSVVAKPVFRGGLLGTGTWKVKKLNLVSNFVDQLILENNKKERIIYKFYPTEERLKLAFELGEVDRCVGLLNADPLDKWPKVKIIKNIDKSVFVAMFFNTSDKLLADKSLRQALSYATKKDNLGGERAISPVPSTSWAFNSLVKPYSYDLNKAKSMINSMDPAVKNNLNITITTSPLLLPQAELIEKDWNEIGVKTNVQVMSNVPTNYQAILAIFDAPDDPDQYSVWHSTQTQTNITRYSNPRIDKLLEDGRTIIDIAQRKPIYLDFQRFLVEDSPAIFLYYPTQYTIER
jgi:peptide/nickel transport system substrate-binding protein